MLSIKEKEESNMRSKITKIIGLLIFVMLSQTGITYAYNGIMSKVKNAVLPFNFKKNNNQQVSSQPLYRLVEPESVVAKLKAPQNKPERIAFAKSIGLTGNETAQIAGYNRIGNKGQDMKSAVNTVEREDVGIGLTGAGLLITVVGGIMMVPLVKDKADLMRIEEDDVMSKIWKPKHKFFEWSSSKDTNEVLMKDLRSAGMGLGMVVVGLAMIGFGVNKIVSSTRDSNPYHTNDTIMFKNGYHSTFHFAKNLSRCDKGEGRIVQDQDGNILAGPKSRDNNITNIIAADGYSIGTKLKPNKYGDIQCALYYYRNKKVADKIVRDYFSLQVNQISNDQINPQIIADFIPAGKNLESNIQGKIAFIKQPAYQINSNKKYSGGVVVVDLSPKLPNI